MLMLISMIQLPAIAEETTDFQLIVNVPKNDYTPVMVEGFDGTIFVFIDKDGTAQCRVYGKLGSKKGFFPIELSESGEVNITDTNPVKDAKTSFGHAKIAADKQDVPSGFTKTARKNIFAMLNLFGEKEHVAYASYDGENFGYYPIAKNNQPIPGHPALDVDAMLEHSKATVGKKYKRPAGLKGEFARAVILPIGSGSTLSAKTAYPELDMDNITAGGRPSFGGGGSYGGGGGKGGGSGEGSKAYKAYQQLLKNLGFYSGTVDGKVGPKTVEAIKKYQEKNGLSVTGKFDNATVAKMKSGSHKNASGVTVSTSVIEVAPDQTAANKGIGRATANITLNRTQIRSDETLTASVKLVNPDNVQNLKLIIDVVKDGQTYKQATFNGTDGALTVGGDLPEGKYTVRSFLNAGNGNAGRDMKYFNVVKKLDVPSDISEEDKANDRYLSASITPTSAAVKPGDTVTVKVTLHNYVPSHTYTIQMNGAIGMQTRTGTSAEFTGQIPGSTGEHIVTVSVLTPSGNNNKTLTAKFTASTSGGGGGDLGGVDKATYQQWINDANARLTALRAEATELQGSIGVLEATLSAPGISAEQIAQINNQLSAKRARLAEVQAEIANLETKIAQWTAAMNALP